jgi:prepilin-type N-terminal cleavage/methylation domain-containing protein/prepilin-type processing-associated H-X9-DG protein
MKDLLKNKQKEGVKVRMFTRKEKGFTLIELLVVIAIIAILAAILFPVFAKAREKARQSSCQSNLKQIALSLNMYSQDYDECFPAQNFDTDTNKCAPDATLTFATDYSNDPDVGATWIGSLAPYMKSTKIFICPTIGAQGYTEPATYAANSNVLATISSGISQPTETCLLIDYKVAANKTSVTADAFDNAKMSPHSDGANIAFIDGHVKWMKGSDAATKLAWKADGTLPTP